jgi:hypothetical protein
MSDNNGGISFGGLLFLIFLTLKLCNVITWSWWWVTAPLWFPLAIVLGFLLFFTGIAVIIMGIAAIASVIFAITDGK